MTRPRIRDITRHGLERGPNVVATDTGLVVIVSAARMAPANPLGDEFAVIKPRKVPRGKSEEE